MNPEIARDPFAAGKTDVSPGTVEKVRAVFSSLSKLVLGKKIYAENNPTLIKFADEFDSALYDFFKDDDELVVSVDKYAIRWGEQTVYENDRRDESIAFLLYKDGIGEISIQSSVTSSEMGKFVNLIKDEVRSLSRDEDIVTKLWKADFEHISYRVLDEYLVGEFGEGRRGESDEEFSSLEAKDHPEIPSFADKGRMIVGSGGDLVPFDTYLRDLVRRGGHGLSDEEMEEHFQDTMASFFAVSGEELRRCQDELLEAKQRDSVVSFIDEYLDFTLIRDNPSAARDVLNVIECLTDHVISELHGPTLGETLVCIRDFVNTRRVPAEIGAFCESLEKKLTDMSVLVSMGETAANLDRGTAQVFGYYEVVGRKAIPAIRRLLEENTDPNLHREACECLVKIGGDEIPAIIDQLDIDKPLIAQDVIRLIKFGDSNEIPNVIKELLYYPDFRVRTDAIQYLVGLGNDEAAMLLCKLISDAEKGTRMRAIAAVSQVAHPLVRDKIEELALSKELPQRELDEQIEIYRTFGKLAGKDAVPHVRQLTGKRSFFIFGKRQNKDGKLLAVHALEQIDGAEALELLKELADDSDSRVRTAASQVLRRFEKDADGSKPSESDGVEDEG
ncbi:MAG: hypothetical protein JSW58_06540 [Candidatus Latescibacterota bacterium]|nr:MAG: hypothetical protein JSW58_06540 [Candidatus Latescibacterota bacterium]